MKSVANMPQLWGTIEKKFSISLLLPILAFPAALFLGVAVGALNQTFGLALAGTLVIVILVLLRWDELTMTLIIAIHLWIDWYFDLHLVGILMALVLFCVYYFGRSFNHPWVRPRPLWLWISFLLLTIYPAIEGGQFLLFDAATYYPSIILGAFLMFCLGNIIARNIQALRRIFQFLSVIGTLIAIHTIIETITGVFMFSSAREDIHLVTARNLDIGSNALRSASFFVDPNWNGCFLVMMFFLPLGLLFESKSILGKLIFLLEMVLILVALMFTYSNGSWIALIAGVLAFAFWVGSQHYRLLWIVIVTLISLLIQELFQTQLALQLQHASTPFELSLRVGAWQTAVRVMELFPLFGVGLGNQAYLIRANPYRVPNQIIPLMHPHNAYLQWGAMAGIPVLVVFLLLQGYAFWCSWRNWRSIDIRHRPLLGGGITALIALSVNSVSIDGWTNAVIATFAWLIFGLVASPLLHEYAHNPKHSRSCYKESSSA